MAKKTTPPAGNRNISLRVGPLAAATLAWAGLAMSAPFAEPEEASSAHVSSPGGGVVTQQAHETQRPWMDAEGTPLPFAADEDIEELLRTADVIERQELPIGVTDPQLLTLEKDGIKVHAVFRYVDTVHSNVRMADGRTRTNLKDSCHFETAAYALSSHLGLDVVPPVITRRIGTDNGTLQIWLYDALMEGERAEQGLRPPDGMAWRRQVQQMYAFDALIGNDDRTQQNILIDQDFKIWLIDHTRAFYRYADMANLEKVNYVERGFWEGLQSLDETAATEVLGEYLTSSEIAVLLERRDRVVEHIQGLVDERGEGAVIFEWPGGAS